MFSQCSFCSFKVHHPVVFFILLYCLPPNPVTAQELVIIGDYGVEKQLVEHTLPAVTLAATRGVDYVELPVMMTADSQLVVFRELTLNQRTDVAKLFPTRSRNDNGYYVIDFTLAEIRQMRLPPLSLAIPTLNEALNLIRSLELILSRQIGISLEIKHPWFHLDKGKDISSASLDILADYGYIDKDSKLFVQCFDPEELQRIHDKLLPAKQLNIPLIQLIDNNDGHETKRRSSSKLSPYSYDWLYTNSGLKIVSSYASIIALPTDRVADTDGNLLLTDYIASVHGLGLGVFVFPADKLNKKLPHYADTYTALLNFYLEKVNLDGLYTNSLTSTPPEIQQ